MKIINQSTLRLTIVGIIPMAVTSANADVVYMRSTVGAPWGENTNETAMDTVFGAGNWSDLRYETVAPATLFSPTNTFIFMEGSDDNANELESFLSSNQATLENWVSNGGSLLLNSAPNEGDGMDYGFGGVSLTYTAFSGTATATDPAHPIFQGPHGTTGSSFTGTQFSHATVSGGGISSLLEGDVGTILADKAFGSGYVMFGGMTTDNFHSPDPESANLRANIIDYAANEATAVIPEPGQTVTLAAFLSAACLVRRRLKK